MLLAIAASLLVQLPDGMLVVTAARAAHDCAHAGAGGLYLAHPRRPGWLTAIGGVPPALTGSYVPGESAGASCIAATVNRGGELLVGVEAPHGHAIELWQLRLDACGTTVVSAVPILLGAAGQMDGGVTGIAPISGDEALCVGNHIAGLPSLGIGAMRLGRVDLNTGATTPVPLGFFAGAGTVEGVAYDPITQMGWFVTSAGRPPRATVFEFDLAAPTTPRTVARLPGQPTGLARSASGLLHVSLRGRDATAPSLVSLDPATGVTAAPVTGFAAVEAVTVEPSTGELILCATPPACVAATSGVFWTPVVGPSPALLASSPSAAGSRGPLTGVAALPAPTVVGAPSGPPPAFAWSRKPHPDRLPLAGNSRFVVDVAWPSGASPLASVWIASGAASPLPVAFSGVDILVDGTAVLGSGAMTLDPVARRSVLSFPIPSVATGACRPAVHLQSAHLTATGLHASELLRVPVL